MNLRRAAPLACGCLLAAGAALVAFNDPADSGSWFPACTFRTATGLWCPGCGLTRGFHQLLTGHPLAALGENLFVPLAMAAIVGAWWSWLRTSRGGQALRLPSWAPRMIAVLLPVTLVAYGVLRNIPRAPFSALAP